MNAAGSAETTRELFDPEFLDRLRAFYLRLRKRRVLRKKGTQSTPATGFTREFKDFRRYTHNDDYRAVDWQLYARLEKLFIRLYEEVQEFHVHMIIDTSGSMATPHTDKRRSALRVAVALSYLGLVSQHRVSLYSMSDELRSLLPMVKGPGNIHKMMEILAQLEFGGLTQLQKCFTSFRPHRDRQGIIFVISDFFGRELGSCLNAIPRTVAWPGEVHFVQVHHPEEACPAFEGEVELVDAETKEVRRMWFTKSDRVRYEKRFLEFTEELRSACARRRIDHFAWRTDVSFEEGFLQLLSRGSALAES